MCFFLLLLLVMLLAVMILKLVLCFDVVGFM
jgi:hypothetical protein